MAERKPGPVQPPTIDLTARPVTSSPEPDAVASEPEAVIPPKPVRPRRAGAPKTPRSVDTPEPSGDDPALAGAEAIPPPVPGAEPGESRPREPEAAPRELRDPPPPPPPRPAMREELFDDEPPRRPMLGWSALVTAIFVGALVGTALTYALASFIPLRASGPVFADPTEQVATHDARLQTLEERFQGVEEGVMDADVRLDAALLEMQQSIAGLRTDIPAPIDLSAIESRLRTLAGRVDAIAAGASSADAGALAENLAAMADTLPALAARLDALEKTNAAAIATLAELQASLVEPETPPPPAPDALAAADALERAIGAGKPYSIELASLRALTPAIVVPEAVTARAARGLPDPEALARRFETRVPDMLAARRPDPSAAWQDTAGEWLKALLAWRPAEEVEGNAPEAVMSRLEAAMARRNFTEAAPLFALLPPDMQAAAGDVVTDVTAWAEAKKLIADLRGTPPSGVAQ